mmetsp:Transcript_9952/g.25655  ORF Transcript_9952/g.25655 Transcript_9952/m.25655 type:complete len:153 (-) Transcript_9952:3127-3585(-)
MHAPHSLMPSRGMPSITSSMNAWACLGICVVLHKKILQQALHAYSRHLQHFRPSENPARSLKKPCSSLCMHKAGTSSSCTPAGACQLTSLASDPFHVLQHACQQERTGRCVRPGTFLTPTGAGLPHGALSCATPSHGLEEALHVQHAGGQLP